MTHKRSDLPSSQAMPVKRWPRIRSVVLFLAVVVTGLCLFLVFDRNSSAHSILFGTMPFSWEKVFMSFADYGSWLFTVYLVVTAIILFLESRNPDRTLAWLLVLALLPVFGVLLYWLVGPNLRYMADKRRFRLPMPSTPASEVVARDFSPVKADTALLVYRSSGSHLLKAVNPRILNNGPKTFDRIKECLSRATKSILLESYIINNDRTGNEIKDILIERARAGVLVCVLYDAVGSWQIGRGYLKALRDAGVHTVAFLPVAFPMLRGANYRNHRKILVVDGKTAFMGGMNIGDEYAGINPKYSNWRDTHIEFQGEVVADLHALFIKDFAACCRDADVIATVRDLPAPTVVPSGKGSLTQIVASGPDTPWDTINKAYLSVISRARQKLWLTSPYLVPGDALMEAIQMASLSGVDVRLMLPGKGDHPVVYWASMNCCDDLLRAGVRIFLYDTKGFIHGKTIVCDGQIFSVGSANLDTRSLRINFEVQAFLYDNVLAAEAERVFEEDMQHARELTFREWRTRSKIEKVKESVGKLFSSLV